MGRTSEKPISAGQVLRWLADQEQAGSEFYRTMLEGTKSAWLKQLAGKMVEAEQRHRERFLEYAQRADNAESPGEGGLEQPLPDDLLRLLRSHVFPERARYQVAVKYAGDRETLMLAIQAEEGLALLLTQLRQYVPAAQKRFIDRVTKEEWGHKAKLERVMQKHLG